MSVRGAKILSVVLAAVCGALLLVAIALQIGVGRGFRWLPLDDDVIASVGGSTIDRQPFKLPPESAFGETTERPLFNEDRKPTPEPPEAPVNPPPPPVALNVNLTGVILTPAVHIAMLHDNGKNDQFTVKEGMPLPGDLGGWTLTKVKQRSALFKESAGEEVEVELSTAVASPKPGSAPARPGAPQLPAAATVAAQGQKPPAPPAQGGKPAEVSSAEQLQRRIEERRKQMRDEAERLKQQQQANPQH